MNEQRFKIRTLFRTISREEYTAKKEKIIKEKAELSEKSKDFERNGNHWIEPARQFILAAQQAKIIALQENPVAGRDFLKRIGSNRVLLSQKVAIEPKKSWQILYNLPAEARSAEATNSQHTIWLPQPWITITADFTSIIQAFQDLSYIGELRQRWQENKELQVNLSNVSTV